MDRVKGIDGFDLDNYLIFHDEIQSQTTLQSYAFVLNRQVFLLFEVKAAQIQLASEAGLVNAFEESGSQLFVDFDGCSNDFPGQILMKHIHSL